LKCHDADHEENKALISSIVDFLIGQPVIHAVFSPEAREALIELKALIRSWDILADGDIVGYVYQHIQSETRKKRQGQYYTPPEIVEYIITNCLSSSVQSENISILDPACGSGQFLLAAYRHLFKKHSPCLGSKFPVAERLLSSNIFGNDIDPIASKIARFNLKKVSGVSDDSIINICNNNYIFHPSNNSNIFNRNYDLIIGNPPWGSRLTPGEKQLSRRFFSSALSGINSFTMFMERSLGNINAGGVIAFLVPEAFLNIKSHMASRELLLGKCCLIDIALWGEQFNNVFAPAVSIIFKEQKDLSSRKKNIVHITNPHLTKQLTTTLIPQHYYETTPEKIFNIHYTRKAVSLLTRINECDCYNLKGNARFFLGVVTGNNPGMITTEQSSRYPDPIILAKDLSQYKISFSSHYFKFDPYCLQQVAPKECYLAKNKVLYKFIGKRLTFALDMEGRFTLNNVNGFIPTDSSIDPVCLVALLNSSLIQYYYEKNFFTIKVLRGNLERLPIKHFSTQSQKQIHHLSSSIISNPSSPENGNNRENIESMIFHEYGIPDKEAYLIRDAVSARTYHEFNEKSMVPADYSNRQNSYPVEDSLIN